MKEISKRNTVVPHTEQHPIRSSAFSWDELRYFLAVCEHGSFRAAADHFNVSVGTIRRKIETLEAELSTILFTRSASGAVMTPDARSVYSISLEVRERIGYLDNFASRRASAAEGLVRLTVTEGLGSFWLSPQISTFVEKYPRIRLELRCEMRIPDLSRLETDVAVQLEEPSDDILVRKKIATIHLLMFASSDYLQKYESPASYEDLTDHRFIHLVADQIPHHMLEERVLSDPQFKFARVVTNSSCAQVLVMADGGGIGVLPSYAAALSDKLQPVNMPFHISRPVWLVYHPDSMRLQRVRTVVDWITKSFDSKKFPWFHDQFISPSDFSTKLADFPLFVRANGKFK